MKKNVFITCVVVTAIAVTGSTVMARDDRMRGKIDFEALDADANGRVTQTELGAHRAARLAAIDTDGDGFLSLSELEAQGEARAAKRAERMMSRLDKNEDGKLSVTELTQESRRAKMFERIDSDGDGAITKAEFEAARDKMKNRSNGGADQ